MSATSKIPITRAVAHRIELAQTFAKRCRALSTGKYSGRWSRRQKLTRGSEAGTASKDDDHPVSL